MCRLTLVVATVWVSGYLVGSLQASRRGVFEFLSARLGATSLEDLQGQWSDSELSPRQPSSAGGAAAQPGAAAASKAGSAKRNTVKMEFCSDTCPTANDGKCDEGRPSKGQAGDAAASNIALHTTYRVLCDLGTDCGDCGAWEIEGPAEAAEWRPVEEIRAKGYEVRTKRTKLPEPFWMAYADPSKDVDVSRHIDSSGILESALSIVWHKILSAGPCVAPDGARRLVADVGANFGYYSLLAASMGCRVVAWEPVPYFAAYFKYGLLRNGLTSLVELHETVVGDEHGGELTIVVPQRGIWGTAGVGGMNIDEAIDNEGDYDKVPRAAERLDRVVQEDLLLLKVDVEGFEPHVLSSAKGLLTGHVVENIVMEYSPGVAERVHDMALYEANPGRLLGLVQAGYTVFHLGMTTDADVVHAGWQGRLPALEVVTRASLRNDIEDAYRLANNSMGCPLPEGVPLWGCNNLPETVHPLSFRSTFGHNTNVWARLAGAPPLADQGPQASLFPAGYDLSKTFFSPGPFGAGRRLCMGLDPKVQVPHRCPCTDKAVCGELEEKVIKAAAAGKMPPLAAPRAFEESRYFIDKW